MGCSKINSREFEMRGGSGCSNSDHAFVITTCCAHVGVEDGELHIFYWDPADLGRCVRLYEVGQCPVCGEVDWDIVAAPEDEPAVPQEWQKYCAHE
jgi:hypothetical protein